MVLLQRLEQWDLMKEVETGGVVWTDVLGLVGCIRMASRSLCDVGFRKDLDHGGN